MKNCFKSFKILFKEFPLYIFLKIYNVFNSVFISLMPIYIINYIMKFYEANKDIILSNNQIFKLILYIILLCVIMFILYEISYGISLYEDYVSRNFENRMSVKFFNKMIKMDYDLYETPVFLNDYVRSLEDGPSQMFNSASGLLNLVEDGVKILSILGIIISIHFSIIIYVIITGIIYFLLRLFMSKINFKFHTLKRPEMRKARYSNRAFVLKDSIPDIKTTNIEEILLDNNDKAFDKVISLHKKYISKRTILSVISEVLMGLMYPVIILLISIFSMDNFDVVVFSSLTVASSTLTFVINKIAKDLGRLQDAMVELVIPFELLERKANIEIEKEYKNIGSFDNLVIENVSFSYDNKNNALDNISLDIKKKEKIAIVGINGAGKTTLVKLLLRLYDVNSGNIKINGFNYNDLDVREIRSKVGAVFQNCETYAVSIAENILLKHIENDEDIALVNEALKFSGLYDFVYTLKDNIYTPVTKQFMNDGIVFSGGQMQKLAIARGYAQNYELFILDEPSSSLDPLAEAKIYKNMLEMGKDKTMVFISHRLTTTVNADKIYLFNNGKIVEAGTHQELINKNGLYKKMFESQSVKYLGEEYETK